MDTLDDHSGWGACAEEVADIANQRLKEIVSDAAQEAATQGWGSLTGSLRTDIMATLNTKVDWRKVLRYFVKASQRADRKSTIRRINRRYPYIHAGKKSARQSNVAISIDQSGSVSDDLLAMFFAELNKLSDIASFTVVPFDTVVDESEVYVWKKGQSRTAKRVLSGGTCFDAPTEYVNKRSFDAHIILTDMGAPKPRPSKCQRMWMTTKQYLNNSYFDTNERVVAVD
jgi:predicted metal-dependent peptidase